MLVKSMTVSAKKKEKTLVGNVGMSMSLASQDRETDRRGKRQEELIQLPDMSLR